ncbi:hydrolase, NUDIX family [Cooperia oncophora]
MRISKSAAGCPSCSRIFYPTFSPVAITLVSDPTDSYALLIRHKASPASLYTAIAGFAQSGESLEECARREIAEEVGIPAYGVVSLNRTQPWPMPDSSLMCAHYAVAEMSHKIDACPGELESARWFSREEVAAALQRTLSDPAFRKMWRIDRSSCTFLLMVQSPHYMIKAWVERRLCIHEHLHKENAASQQ